MITTGTVLIDKDAPHPACFPLERDFMPAGWLRVTLGLSPRELDNELSREGWTFFYIAISLSRTAFGFNTARMLNAALGRIIRAVEKEGCNCVQIDQIRTHSILWIPCVTVSAHPRHIQRGMIFSGPRM